MAAYYNEFEPYAAQWLRNLIAAGHIATGDVDERSITEVQPDDLRGYTQCHFFAGIGGWSLALRLAGWDDSRPVWTGSCPCQPFSAAGKQLGVEDPRHLWPAWFRLIRECRPAVVFGEQVEAAIRLDWLDLVQDDLEGLGYAFGAAGLPAACVGAPHIRQRLWFVADSSSTGPQGHKQPGQRAGAQRAATERGGDAGALADEHADRREGLEVAGLRRAAVHDADGCGAGFVANGQEHGRQQGLRHVKERPGPTEHGAGFVGDASSRGARTDEQPRQLRSSLETGAWDDLIWLPCRDGKARPTQPGIQPLASRVPARVGKLRAAGNAIVPQVAAEFIRACAVPEMIRRAALGGLTEAEP